jgi:acyl-CoA thioester hydrolase
MGLGQAVRSACALQQDKLRPVKIALSRCDPAAFVFPLRVYYEDTDAGGVVYYANYLKFFERCRTEWLRSLGVDQSELARERGLQFVVAEIEAKYLAPARLDDELAIEARVVRLGRCSLEFDQRAQRAGVTLAHGRVKVACVDAQRRMPARLPEILVSKIRTAAAVLRGAEDGVDADLKLG